MNRSVTQMGVQLTKGTLFLVNNKDEVNFALMYDGVTNDVVLWAKLWVAVILLVVNSLSFVPRTKGQPISSGLTDVFVNGRM